MRETRFPRLLLAACLFAILTSCSRDHAPGRFILLISIDTLRADHLGCYGYGRATSPAIDRFATEEGVVFDAAYAQAPYTLPSHMSMLTSLYPEAHGILEPVDRKTRGTARLAPGVVTLAEALQSAGFVTAGFTDGLLVDRMYGFGDGFDHYEDERFEDASRNGFRNWGERLHEYVRRNAGEDVFLFVHTYDVHGPYPSPVEYRSRFREEPPGREIEERSLLVPSRLARQDYMELEQYEDLQAVIDRYDSTIAYVDDEIGKLFDLLRDLDLWQQAMIIVTSDHGENFLDKGSAIGHGFFATNEEVRVPLVVKFPANRFASSRIDAIVELVDIMPTILTELEVAPPEGIDGQDLAIGIETGRWEKSHAFGVSPSAGGFAYLLRDGLKFVDAMPIRTRAVRSYFQPHLIRPLDPSGIVYSVRDRKLRYDFESDPLGVFDDLFAEPRAFDVAEVPFEWQAPEVTDMETVRELDELASALSQMSAEKHRRLVGDDSTGQEALTDAQRERLAELGYVEFAESTTSTEEAESATSTDDAESIHPAEDAESDPTAADPGSDEEGDELEPAIAAVFEGLNLDERTRPFTSEELAILDRGDGAAWELWRMAKGQADPAPPPELEQLADEARSAYGELSERRADRPASVEWRLRLVDRLLEHLEAKRGE